MLLPKRLLAVLGAAFLVVAFALGGEAEAQANRRPQRERRPRGQAGQAEATAEETAKEGGQADAPAAEKAPDADAGPAELRIEPKKGRIAPGGEMTFEVKAFDADGNETPVEPVWSALIGRITPKGEYTASRREGGCIVTATDPHNGLKAQAPLLVSSAEEDAIGEIQVIRWNIQRRTAFLARTDIAIRFVGSDKARMARLFVHQKGGTINQLQSARCLEGRIVQFGFIFNPSTAERIEVCAYDFRNRALASTMREMEQD